MSFSNPRRRTPMTRQDAEAGHSLSLKTNMILRKGATFHSPPASPTPSIEDAFVPPPLIRRSQTNLDDVVDAHRRRVALTLDTIDKSLSQTEAMSSPKKQVFRDDSLPVPRGFLNPPVVDPAMSKTDMEKRVLRPRHRRPSRHHESDSGIGSSIASTNDKQSISTVSKRETRASAITRSVVASSTAAKVPGLSSKAVNRIHEHILRPLRAKPSLKDFEPIILDIPRRIQEKDIICLRDLEKTLTLMAPERAKTATLYLDFCLESIRCIQATVDYLSDREQTRPGDRPYTNGYFIDLVEQIHQYAKQLSHAKERGANGDEMEVDASDQLKLFGGINENGRPAELVRVRKDGKAYSIATGLPVDIDEDVKGPIKMKRSLSEQAEDDEEIMRSMARRKKNASPEELAPKKCREPGCNKEFKRPCDLTKHEKTHSRPWKCPVKTCKYHEYGWPTEKEMDRHHNDKHSSAPPMYECLFKPCPYKSKRESNCKQHMEKAHGWTYVRTKTNGKKGDSKAGSVAQATPLLGNMPTPSSNGSIATPPDEHISRFVSPPFHLDFPTYVSDEEFMMNVQRPSVLDEFHMDLSPLDHTSPSTDASYGPYSATYQDGPDFTINEDIYSAHAQLPTPDHAAFGKIMAGLEAFDATDMCQPQQIIHGQTASHISPIGHGNAMLYTPNSLAEVDEGFEDYNAGGDMGNDFQLFPSTAPTKMNHYEPLFGEVPSAGLGYSQTASQDIFQGHMDWSNIDYQTFPEHQ